ncbi:HIT domain protein [Spraguea lophii 42_110]|uniref:HIT domain protein n=1 Tax=Spraguea lophii (strain 42_110) TaxID=1358809 RepID=S7W7G0_SPRLO|nr:HIT domain protein [Spraguea lophii 42_110]
MASCLFCTLAHSKDAIIYENDECSVLLDINPISKGHLLILPKVHAEYLHQLENKYLSSMMILAKDIVNKLNIKKYNILQNNGNIQEIFHVHLHVIPVDAEGNKFKIVGGHLNYKDGELEEIKKEYKKLLN